MNNKKSGRMLIDGKLVTSESNAWLECVNPADEKIIGYMPAASTLDVNRAVDAAKRAQPTWGALAPAIRANYITKIAHALRDRADEVLKLEVMDTGNTITKMKGDVEHAAHAMEFFAGLSTELKGQSIPASADHLHISVREPYGVVGRIVPFNHPIKFAAHAIAAPLIAGNSVVLKPPEQSPLSAHILAEICRDILPPGVVNIVTGDGTAGNALVCHPAVKRIAFTGSVPTGLAIQRAAADISVKAITLELGGKNPLIAFPDMNPDKIAEVAVHAMNFAWSGQSCGSTSRLLLHESLYKPVLQRVLERVAELRQGDPLDPQTQMGPLNSKRHYERVCSMVQAGIDDNAELKFGGKRPAGKNFERGYWLQPTVFAGVKPNMRIALEEIFGPVLSVFSWRDEAEALAIANGTDYGLTASIWTNDIKTALRMARNIKSGYIWINSASNHFYGTSFGGFKNSGLGREEGLDELLSYTETKAIHIKLV